MNRFMALITAIALFSVQPALPRVVTAPVESDLMANCDQTDSAPDQKQSSNSSNNGQMPEIEVEQFGGELLHVTTQKVFEPVVLGTIEIVPLLDPSEHNPLPLLRPPRA